MHVNPSEGRPYLFLFCLILESVNRNARCAGMVSSASFI